MRGSRVVAINQRPLFVTSFSLFLQYLHEKGEDNVVAETREKKLLAITFSRGDSETADRWRGRMVTRGT